MRRSLVLAGLFLLLTGCGGANDRAPFTESRIPPSLGPRFWAPEGWGWGLIKLGDAPAQRYGVSSTAVAPKASILILTGYGETAEAWFETARDLNALGYSVWVLERAGQGGSERYTGPRELVNVPGFDGDIATTKTLARMIAQGAPDTPLVVLGSGVGGLVAVGTIEGGAPADALVLSAADLKPAGGLSDWQGWLAKVGLGRLPPGPGYGWNREGPDAFTAGLTGDRFRGAVQKQWQTANPDLRMGQPSLGWRAAFAEASSAALKAPSTMQAPALALTAEGDGDWAEAEAFCRALPACRIATIKGGRRQLHLERDAVRRVWLAQVDGFIRERIKARADARYPPALSEHPL